MSLDINKLWNPTNQDDFANEVSKIDNQLVTLTALLQRTELNYEKKESQICSQKSRITALQNRIKDVANVANTMYSAANNAKSKIPEIGNVCIRESK